MARKPEAFVRESENYWILQEYESKSSSSIHEVRTSKNDGKTYCTCRGWIVKLNQSKETGGRPECTHIKQFRKNKKAVAIEVMNFEDFANVKRGIQLIDDAKVGGNVKVRRQ